MGRIRTIKPEAARHEGLFEAEKETGLPIRAAWYTLPTACDREGRFRWRPRALKLDILPYDDIDFSRVLDALLTRGFIVKYRVQREWYGCIPTFRKHQVVNNREAQSELPSIDDAHEVIQEVIDACPTRAPRGLGKDQGEGEREGEREGVKDSVSTPVDTPPAKCAKANGIDFERFWEHWPVKRNKARAKQAFVRKKFDIADVDILIADVEDRKKHDPKWQQGFIPHCSTYLNGNRWEDEYGSTTRKG